MTFQPPLPVPAPPINLAGVTDELLDQLQVTLALACGRSHSTLRGKRRLHFCFLLQGLDAEQTRRGRSRPSPPYSA